MSEMISGSPLPYRRLGIELDDDHVPAPERHRPVTETIVSNGYVGIVVKESDSGAFIHCENPAEVRQ